MSILCLRCVFFFFFNDTATTEIYTLSLHDALPICHDLSTDPAGDACTSTSWTVCADRKSTRLNSSHGYISYAVFCLQKKKKKAYNTDLINCLHTDATSSITHSIH